MAAEAVPSNASAAAKGVVQPASNKMRLNVGMNCRTRLSTPVIKVTVAPQLRGVRATTYDPLSWAWQGQSWNFGEYNQGTVLVVTVQIFQCPRGCDWRRPWRSPSVTVTARGPSYTFWPNC